MSEKKNLDRLFQEKFKDFEAEPSDKTWEYIEARLEEKDDRKIMPFWFRFAGAAAILVVGLMILFNVGNDGFSGDGNNGNVNVVSAPAGKNADSNSKGIDAEKTVVAKSPVDEAVTATDGATTDEASSLNGTQKEAASASEKTKNEKRKNNKKNLSPTIQNQGAEQVADAESNKPSRNKRPTNATNRVKQNAITPVQGENVEGVANVASEKASRGKRNGKTNRANQNTAPSVTNDNAQYASTHKNKTKTGSGITEPEKQNTNPNPKVNGATTKNEASQIAENEKKQSGQTQQHNNIEVTEKTTTSTQAIAEKTVDTKKDSAAVATTEPNALEELLRIEKEKSSVTQSEPKINRWQITSNVAPIYLSSTSDGSPIDSRFSNNEKEYKTKLSYGLGLTYAVSKRVSVRAGVNSMALEYSTNDVVFNQTSNARQLEHVDANLQGSMLNIQSKGQAAASPPELAMNGNITPQFDGTLNQRTGYIEVPIELAYKVIDKRFGVEIIGGMSTLFLNENEISVSSSSTEMEIGKANNLNSMHFSTNVGIGLKYDIIKALQFKLEPMFKYQINTFTDSGNFKPYFFGVYTGLNYRF